MIESHEIPNHQISATDRMMVESIENYQFQLVQFSHAIHVKLAYCYLALHGPQIGLKKMQETLIKFLDFNGVDRNKFHVTLTHAWLNAVWYFMQKSPVIQCAKDFVEANPALLNKDLLAHHYIHELLFSKRARIKFVQPDLNPFPN